MRTTDGSFGSVEKVSNAACSPLPIAVRSVGLRIPIAVLIGFQGCAGSGAPKLPRAINCVFGGIPGAGNGRSRSVEK